MSTSQPPTVAPAIQPWTDAIRAEWTKLRTVASTWWLLLVAALGTVAVSLLASVTVTCGGPGCAGDPARVALTGVAFGQAVVGVLGAMAVGAEYQSGMVRVTYAAMPRRTVVLAAKALVVAGVTAVAGIAGVGLSAVSGVLLLRHHGFTAANGFGGFGLGLGSGEGTGLWRAAGGSVLYLVAVALLGVGLAALARDAAVAVGGVLGLLYLFPIVISVVGDPDWHRRLEQIGPMDAGLAVQNTVGTAGQPLGPWAGLAVAAGWALGALLLGAGWQRVRDA